MVIKMAEDVKKTASKRDEELDVARAAEVAREFIRDNVGNLNRHDFRLESIRKNGDDTKYIIICSVIPDLGLERDYYFIKVDVITGKIVQPTGIGKMSSEGKLVLKKIEIDPKWTK